VPAAAKPMLLLHLLAVHAMGGPSSRRAVLRQGATAAATLAVPHVQAAEPFAAAPAIGRPFDWSRLWGGSAESVLPKQRGLPVSAVAEILRQDLGRNKYILTGELTPTVFAETCHFEDPNNSVDGLSRYRTALSLLFDPQESSLELQSLSTSGPDTILADYVATGTLKLPWRPTISPWAGHIVYKLDADGLVSSQIDVWNITRIDAIRQTFTVLRHAPGVSPASAAECKAEPAVCEQIAERRALFEQSRTTGDRQKILDLSRQRAAMYNTTFRGVSCIPGLPCL